MRTVLNAEPSLGLSERHMIPLTVGGTKYWLDLPTKLPEKAMGHPLHYIVNHPDIAQGYLNIIYDMIKDFPKNQDITDLMGGIGVYPKVYWDLLQPKSWISVEIDPECKQYFQQPKAMLKIGNAYDFEDLSPIVFMDMHGGTLRTIADNMDGRLRMWHNIRSAKPKYVVVTDYGYYWVHLPNHAPWYQKHFGVKPTKENYAGLWDMWMRENIGYRVTKEAHGFQSQYFIMQPL